jgi:hypothetical protein
MTFWDKLQAEVGALLGEGKTVAQMEAEEAALTLPMHRRGTGLVL